MNQDRYPELERRRNMLRIIHEWHGAQMEAEPTLQYDQLIEIMGASASPTPTGEYVVEEVERSNAQILNLFLQLVDEGYINARLGKGYKGGPPFIRAWVRGLTEKGHRLVGGMPDPYAQLIQMLDDIADATWALSDEKMPPEKKQRAQDAVRELKDIVRSLPPGAAGGIAGQIAGELFGG
jgi:hypothetical protein